MTEKADLCLTDPPYGMNYQSGRRKEKHNKIINDAELSWLPEFSRRLRLICNQNIHLYIFSSWHRIEIFKSLLQQNFNIQNILIWHKNNHGSGDLKNDYAPQYEMILLLNTGKRQLRGRRDSNILKFKRVKTEDHPTQKPVYLCEYLITKSTKPGQIIIDPFLGGGSTAVACENRKRRWIGIEKEEKYCEIAARRIEAAASQLSFEDYL